MFTALHFFLESAKFTQGKTFVIPCIDTGRIDTERPITRLNLLLESPQFSQGKTPSCPRRCQRRIYIQCESE